MSKSLPWDNLEGEKYVPAEIRPMKSWVKKGGWVLSLVLIFEGITTRFHVLLIFGILYVLALIMEKSTVVSSRGIEIFYNMKITTHYDLWPWSEIEAVHIEERSNETLVALHFRKGERVKRLFFTKKQAKEIETLGKFKNNKIKFSSSKN